MSQSSTVFEQMNAEEITLDRWIPFLAEFTQENRGAHARLELIGEDVASRVETENRPFDGVSADVKDRERTVWIAFGSIDADHFTHGVHNAIAIRVIPPREHMGAVLAVDSGDGTRTLLQLGLPGEFALPPGS
jgi:hypothetical protein